MKKQKKNYPDFYFKHKSQKDFLLPYSSKSIKKIASYVKGDILEIGVGDGSLIQELLKFSDVKSYTGIDLYREFLDNVKAKIENKTNFQAIHCDFMKYDFNAIKFDTIIAFEVIEHIKEQKKFLFKIKQLLNPGGIAIISTPNKPIYNIVAKIYDGEKDPTHVRELTYMEFQKLFSCFFKNLDSIYMLPVFPRLSFKIGSDKLWYFSELLGKFFKLISLDVILIGKK